MTTGSVTVEVLEHANAWISTAWRAVTKQTTLALGLTAAGFSTFVQTLIGATTEASFRTLIGVDQYSFRNRLMNGSGAINQRAAATNADDTYAHDRWNILTQTGTVACSSLTDPETGAPTGVRITQSQASAQRFGFSQIIESLNCRDMRSASATLSGRVRCSASTTLRYAILEWTGAADAVTSDVVLDWTSASITAGGFFNSTTLTLAGAGSLAVTAATWTSLTALTATLGASGNNYIVIVWTDTTQAQNVTLDYERMQYEPGAVATTFEGRHIAQELALCQRYYRILGDGGNCKVADANQIDVVWSFPEMRVAATATMLTSAPKFWIANGSSTTASGATITFAATFSVRGISVRIGGFSGLTANQQGFTMNNQDIIGLSAEL